MLINCKYCNSKFAINAEEVGFDGRLVKCENCQKEWFQESKPKYLEKKLIELDRSLHATELHLIEQKNGNNDKIAKLEKSLKAKKEELAKQKLLEDRIGLFEKRITDTEKEIETQSLFKNKITKLEKDFVGAKVETRANEVTDTEKLHQIKEIKIDNNLKKDFTNARQETLKINDVIKDQEQQLKLLYEEKIELNQNTLDFQKNKNQLQSEFIHKQQELIKKYENEIKEFKNLHQEYNEKIKEEITEELYNFLKKKIKKNTLKLIFDQQQEIKKFQKKINYLNENGKILETSNRNLLFNLLKINENKKILTEKNKKIQQEYNEKIISLEKENSNLKNQDNERTIRKFIHSRKSFRICENFITISKCS